MNRGVFLVFVVLAACGGQADIPPPPADAALGSWCDVPQGDAGAVYGVQCGGAGVYWTWSDSDGSAHPCSEPPPIGASCSYNGTSGTVGD